MTKMERVNKHIDDGYDFKKVDHNHWKVETTLIEKLLIIGGLIWPIIVCNVLWAVTK